MLRNTRRKRCEQMQHSGAELEVLLFVELFGMTMTTIASNRAIP